MHLVLLTNKLLGGGGRFFGDPTILKHELVFGLIDQLETPRLTNCVVSRPDDAERRSFGHLFQLVYRNRREGSVTKLFDPAGTTFHTEGEAAAPNWFQVIELGALL